MQLSINMTTNGSPSIKWIFIFCAFLVISYISFASHFSMDVAQAIRDKAPVIFMFEKNKIIDFSKLNALKSSFGAQQNNSLDSNQGNMAQNGKYVGDDPNSTMSFTTSPKQDSKIKNKIGNTQGEPQLVQVDILQDIWIYSTFYQYHNPTYNNEPIIQALGLISTNISISSSLTSVTCHFDHNGKTDRQIAGTIRPVNFFWTHQRLNEHGTRYATMKLECVLPSDYRPNLVSFSWPHNKTASHQFIVQYPDSAPKTHISVCYSVLYGGFNNANALQQNIEYSRLMGAGHMYVYNQSVGPDVDDLFRFYSDNNFLTVLPLPLTQQTQDSFYFGQHLAILDCQVRNSNVSTWVALFDSDEYIMPLKHPSWTELLDYLQEMRSQRTNQTVASFSFRHTYYTSKSPNVHQWQTIKSYANITDEDVKFIIDNQIQILLEMNHLRFTGQLRKKSIFRPDLVLEPGAHSPRTTVGNRTSPVGRFQLVEADVAVMAHHRGSVHHGRFYLYPQPYREYVHRLKQAKTDFEIYQRDHGNRYRTKTKQKVTSPSQLFPLEVRQARQQLEADMIKARAAGHDAWIVYPARLAIDGEVVKIIRPNKTIL